MKKNSWWVKALAIFNIVAFIAVVIVNYLANSLPIGGLNTGALSDLYPNLFVPAGITFSIWWLIYLMLCGFLVWQIVDVYKKQSRWFTQTIGVWFLVSCLANISWIFAWHYRIVRLSLLIIVAFLLIHIVLAYKVNIGQKIGSWFDKLFIQVPFSLYVGWLSVATIANTTALLVHVGWNWFGMTDIFWTIAVIIVAALLALIALYKKADIVYASVVIWAFLWIILKRLAVDPVYASSIIWVLGICIAVISLGIGLTFKTWKKN